jgi:hypothetical protein
MKTVVTAFSPGRLLIEGALHKAKRPKRGATAKPATPGKKRA